VNIRRVAANLGDEGIDDDRVELGSGAANHLLERFLDRPGIPVWTFRDHRVKGVTGEDHARPERDLLPCKPVRVSGTVPALVRRTDQR
jgi:hypothetical protein